MKRIAGSLIIKEITFNSVFNNIASILVITLLVIGLDLYEQSIVDRVFGLFIQLDTFHFAMLIPAFMSTVSLDFSSQGASEIIIFGLI